MNAPVISADAVSIRYQPRDRNSHLAVDDVTFEVRQGERFVLLGPSGCGKTSLLMSIAGFIKPASGSLQVRGKHIVGPGPDRAVVFQDFDQLFPWRTVVGNLSFAAKLALGLRGNEARQRSHRYLELVGIRAAADRYPHQLSGGMKQRAAIARALSVEPALLLLDEPFGAVDEITRTSLQRELVRICDSESMTVIMVTHSIPEAVYLADRVMVMSSGPGRIQEIVDTSAIDGFGHPNFGSTVEELRLLLEKGSQPIDQGNAQGAQR
ncbi:ABC transporter ATP-binding protein [Rhodococcus opacus]|nr:ABC transporter ATP-binding protein [Rhodococcus opacus]TQC46110.1 ABC transporter ATP-binding protein [Rhodococcus sp. WS4]